MLGLNLAPEDFARYQEIRKEREREYDKDSSWTIPVVKRPKNNGKSKD